MALTPFNSNGQLPNTKQTLYTATATVIITSVSLVNTDSSARTCNLYVKTGTSRRIIPKDLSLAIGAAAYVTQFELNSGDLIEGDASVTAVVDYVISGAHN